MSTNYLSIIVFLIGATLATGCGDRTNTKADQESTYTIKGDTINAREGAGEGTTGHKYMETTNGDSARIEQ